MAYSVTLLPPIIISYLYQEALHANFIYTFVIILLSGFALWQINKDTTKELRKRDGFLVVVLFWVVLSFYSTLPFILYDNTSINFIDALFESVSGLTTTGATVFTNLDGFPKSILYYRNQLQFFGGMGIIVLAVAILPMLGIGGMQLYKAEITGISKDNKLTPRIAETAKMLWGIYVALTMLCIASYALAGMTIFDAVCFAFGTISTGGFAPHDASIGFYNSRLIEAISMIFMLMGAISFTLHFIVFNEKSMQSYWKDPECRLFIKYLLAVWIITSVVLMYHETSGLSYVLFNESLADNILDSIFHTISVATTTGFISGGFSIWPSFLPFLVLYMGIIGGCAGSTSGGIKIIRIFLLHKQGLHEIKKLIHPQAKFFIKYDNHILDESVSSGVLGFLATYLALFVFFILLLLAADNDLVTAFSAVASGLSNIGPALGAFANDLTEANVFSKLVVIVAMILGRLEIFTVLVLFSPHFWNDR